MSPCGLAGCRVRAVQLEGEVCHQCRRGMGIVAECRGRAGEVLGAEARKGGKHNTELLPGKRGLAPRRCMPGRPALPLPATPYHHPRSEPPDPTCGPQTWAARTSAAGGSRAPRCRWRHTPPRGRCSSRRTQRRCRRARQRPAGGAGRSVKQRALCSTRCITRTATPAAACGSLTARHSASAQPPASLGRAGRAPPGWACRSAWRCHRAGPACRAPAAACQWG